MFYELKAAGRLPRLCQTLLTVTMYLQTNVFMSEGKRYTDEFKIEAFKRITERRYSVQEVAERLGISTKSLHHWRSQLNGNKTACQSSDDLVRIASWRLN